jgi:hypothetical protein
VVLIKSVLSSLPVYFLSFFKAPAGIITKLESLFKQFLWGGCEDERKFNWVSWDKVCRPLEEGGLGIRDLRIFNLALLGKWEWKIRTERRGIWYRTLLNRYGLNDEVIRLGVRGSSSWWNDICQLDIGDRESLDGYSVREAYKDLISRTSCSTSAVWSKVWHKSIPSKVSCMVWRLLQNRLATRDNLCRRGVIGHGSSLCVGECGREETTNHLFFECPKFSGVWYKICRWLGISSAFQKEGLAHIEQFEGLIGSGRAFSSRVRVIWFACVWSIWKARNESIFRNKEICLDSMLEFVKVTSWNWLRIKSSIINYSISSWCLNPRACLGSVEV